MLRLGRTKMIGLALEEMARQEADSRAVRILQPSTQRQVLSNMRLIDVTH